MRRYPGGPHSVPNERTVACRNRKSSDRDPLAKRRDPDHPNRENEIAEKVRGVPTPAVHPNVPL